MFYLHDGDGGDGTVGEGIFGSQGTGVSGTLGEAHFQGVHQARKKLDQLESDKRHYS